MTAALHGQEEVGVGQFTFVRRRNRVSVTEGSVGVRILKGREVLPVAEPGEGETQQRPDQYIYREDREDINQGSHERVQPFVNVCLGFSASFPS